MPDSQHPDVAAKLKQIAKEAKLEEKHVAHALKDIQSTEKTDGKAAKVRRHHP
ncbi:hypothetical protein FIBSPDRAFT_869685 [Athelia psychrophila]|uniref:Uncharacterized protein n=1 Tax=Athelia psychrophila TaxID=1759441 RepID=A0A166BXE0_9AGAM|nr:hypothetical protein FIBSPDRAFT_869685 [Fibularhizoctonia sp. CBS 109695]